MDMRNQGVVNYWLRWAEFGDLEIMDKKLIMLIIESEVKVDELVYIQILQSWVVSNDYVWNMIDCKKRTIVPLYFWKQKINFVLKD